ncbi:LuxR C-terminal-related transcriptional regulator [Thiotrichales bacterium 19X7-9]|nr:LuxR C-terminal-related transcriptional regulator [Thiotrichales bacterium 19X7-9]
MRVSIIDEFDINAIDLSANNNILSIKHKNYINEVFSSAFMKMPYKINYMTIKIEYQGSSIFISNTPVEIIVPYNKAQIWRIDTSYEQIRRCNKPLLFSKINKHFDQFQILLSDKFNIHNFLGFTTFDSTFKITYILGGYNQDYTRTKLTQTQLFEINKQVSLSLHRLKNLIIDQDHRLKISSIALCDNYLKTFFTNPKDNLADVKLSNGELKCLHLYSTGLTTAQISKVTGYKNYTINAYTKSARSKLQAQTTNEAIRIAIKNDLII